MEKKSDIKNEVAKSVGVHIDSLYEFKEELDAIDKQCSYLLSRINAVSEELKRI